MHATGPLTLRPSKIKSLALVVGSLCFTVGGVVMVKSGEPLGWFPAVFFGLCLLVGITILFPGAAYLRITTQGFTVCSLFRARSYQWSDVTEFGVSRAGQRKMVMFNFSDSYAKASSVRSFNASMFGYEGALPDSYGLPHAELAELMNRYLAVYRGDEPVTRFGPGRGRPEQ